MAAGIITTVLEAATTALATTALLVALWLAAAEWAEAELAEPTTALLEASTEVAPQQEALAV